MSEQTNVIPDTMTAIEITEPGGPEVLKPTTRPVPRPKENEVLIQIAAAGVNGPDVMQRKGQYAPPPGASDIPGLEVSGVVVAIGSKVHRIKPGDHVAALIPGGGYAQYCVADEINILPLPPELSLTEAAALPETFMTVWLNMFQRGQFKSGDIILIHGGASGIGLAIVEELLAQGANVQMVDIHGGDGQYEGHKGYQFWPTDISSAKEVNHTVAEIIQRFGRIDGLVNNAGVNFPRLLVDEKAPAGQYELNEAAFEKMVNINQKGVFLMSQAVARQMVKQHDGVIVNVSSESGLEGSEGQSCYAATKAALNSFTRSWSKELGKHGIRVVGIAPGILEKTGLRTPEYEEALAWTRNITVEQLREGYTKNAIPIGRAGRLAEVADFVCYLLSERASYITGVTTNIAGGKTRG